MPRDQLITTKPRTHARQSRRFGASPCLALSGGSFVPSLMTCVTDLSRDVGDTSG